MQLEYKELINHLLHNQNLITLVSIKEICHRCHKKYHPLSLLVYSQVYKRNRNFQKKMISHLKYLKIIIDTSMSNAILLLKT